MQIQRESNHLELFITKTLQCTNRVTSRAQIESSQRAFQQSSVDAPENMSPRYINEKAR
jgi:hypothetical protein